MSILPRTTVRKRSRLLAATLLPFTLLMAACKMETTVEFKEDGTSVSSIIFEDDEGKTRGRNLTCESALEQVKQASQGRRSSSGVDLSKVRVEDLSNGGNLKCKLIQSQTKQESGLTKTSDGYVLKVPANPSLNTSSFGGQVKVKFKIVMPGKITKASGNGKINGNTVTYEGLDIMSQGAEIKAAAGGGSGGGSDDESDNGGTAANPEASSKGDSDGGFPMWAWFAIGGGAAALLLVIILVATRKGKGSNPGYAYAGAPIGQPQAPQQFGAPQAPQQFGAPQAPQQFGQPQAPQQFGQPQNQQGYSQYPPQQGGGYPQNPPQQGGY